MSGAASQCDTFDYKPELIKRNGQTFDPGGKVELFQSAPGAVHGEPLGLEAVRPVRQVGQRPGAAPGRRASTTSPSSTRWSRSRTCTARPRSCRTPASCCRASPAWARGSRYGLGSLNDNLPTFVVLPDARGFAAQRAGQLERGLPAGRAPGDDDPARRQEPDRRPVSARRRQVHHAAKRSATGCELLQAAEPRAPGRAARATRGSKRGSPRTSWRRGCSSARRRCSTSRARPTATRRLYGLDEKITEDFGRNCLIARRLLERGVRFVQVWSGADNGFPRRNWDTHEDLARDHGDMGTQHGPARRGAAQGPEGARPARRHDRHLDDRVRPHAVQPGGQGPRPQSRSRSPPGWPAAASRGGVTYGASDEWSYKAVDKPTYCYDLHATVLHLLGIDHDAADLPPQRHRPPPDRRARPGDPRDPGIASRFIKWSRKISVMS